MSSNIGKAFEWWFRKLRLAPRLLLEYGTLSPTRVKLYQGISPIHINPNDRRAVKKVLFDSLRERYPINRRFWIDFVGTLQPSLALDIGANYGECAFSLPYGPQTTVLAFEANPILIPYLEKSRAEHPDSERIRLVNALVAAQPGKQVDFFVNETWSGRSTAIDSIAETMPGHSVVKLNTVSVDSTVSDLGLAPGGLVFKIDVEGYEPYVLMGMQKTLEQASYAVGLIEVDTRFLDKTGWPLQRYETEVLYAFDLYAPTEKNGCRYRKIGSLTDHVRTAGRSGVHFDLLLIKKGVGLPRLPDGWELRDA